MRDFKIKKAKTTSIFSISPEQDRVQLLTKIAADLERYSPEDMPEIKTIRNWVGRELARSLTKVKVQNLFSSKD